MFELKNGDGVLGAVADEQFFAAPVKRQRIRLRAEQVRRILPRAQRLDDGVGVGVNDAYGVVTGIGAGEGFSVRRERQRAGVAAGQNFELLALCSGLRVQINHGHRAFAGNRAVVHAHGSIDANGADDTVGIRPAAAPVAHVDFVPAQRDIVRCVPHVPHPRNFPCGGIYFHQPVGHVARDVDFFAVGRDGDAGGNFIFAPRLVRRRQRNGKQRRNAFVLADAKNLYVAIHVGEIDPPAVGRKRDAGEAQFRFFVRAKDERGNRPNRLVVRRKRRVLPDFSGGGVHDNQLGLQAGSHEQPAVGTQRQRIGPDAGQLDERSGGRDPLVVGCLQSIGLAAHNGRRGVEISRHIRSRNRAAGQRCQGAKTQNVTLHW